MRLVNMGGEWPVLVPGTLLLFVVFPRARQHWWVWVLLMLTAPLAETGMKYLVGRPRPEDGSFGFPSGHATAAAAFFGAVGYLAGGLPASLRLVVRPAAGLAIVLVALARVILRAHWPSDAVAGVALGLAGRARRRHGPPAQPRSLTRGRRTGTPRTPGRISAAGGRRGREPCGPRRR